MGGWRGMLAPLDVSTGDGRRFLSSGVTSRELPLPLKWQRMDTDGHDTSVIVGSLERIEYGTVDEAIEAGWINAKCVKKSKFAGDMRAAWGFGRLFNDVSPHEMPRLAEDVAEATHLLTQQVIGPSVDAGACEAVIAVKGEDEAISDERFNELFWGDDAGDDVELELLFTEYTIAAATLVAVPAFAECRPFELVDEGVLTAAVRKTGWSDMPLAERDVTWDKTAAEKRVADNAGIGGDNPDWSRYAEGFLYQDDEANPETKGAYGFLIVDMIDGTQRIVPRGVFAVANVLSGGRGGTNIPQADQDAMKGVVEGLYRRMADEFDDDTIVVPWAEETASIVAAVMAADRPTVTYDPSMFADPQLDRITPPTMTDDGRVFGHVATHDVCHVGMPGVCTTAPVDDDQYRTFHRYQPDGVPVPVGRITTGAGNFRCTCRQCRGANDDHACLKLSAGGAIAHHDRLSTIAWVRAGEDSRLNAVWISGVVNPEASVEDLAVLARQKVSGDWRPMGVQHRLVEVLALAREEPGFPLPHFRLASGRVAALTAAGVVHPVKGGSEDEVTIDYERLADLLAGRLAIKLQPPAQPVVTAADSDVPTANAVDVDVAGMIGEIVEATDAGRVIGLRSELNEVL